MAVLMLDPLVSRPSLSSPDPGGSGPSTWTFPLPPSSHARNSLPPSFYLAGLANNRSSTRGCYLTAIVDGDKRLFASAKEKFEALAASWDDFNLGRSVLDYHDFAMQQVIGMGADAVPFLLQRVSGGAAEWVYALKSITGQEADTPKMLGEETQVISAWVKWGAQDGAADGQAR